MAITVLRVRFLGDAVAGRTYDYFVPPFIKAAVRPGGHVVVATAGSGGEHKLVEIVEINPDGHKATKAIVGTADLSDSLRHQEAMRERRKLVAALERLDRLRQEDLRLQELAKTSEEGAAIYAQLKALNTTLGLDGLSPTSADEAVL